MLYPFTGGGANWGSAAFDPDRNLLVVNMNNLAHHVMLFASEELKNIRKVFHDQEVSPQQGAPFGMKREVLMSKLGLPCTSPPWGIIAGGLVFIAGGYSRLDSKLGDHLVASSLEE